MLYKPTDQQEQIKNVAGGLVTFLSDESVIVPGNMVEGIVSGKSLLRALAEGKLVLCEAKETANEAQASGKKVAKKVARKKAEK